MYMPPAVTPEPALYPEYIMNSPDSAEPGKERGEPRSHWCPNIAKTYESQDLKGINPCLIGKSMRSIVLLLAQ